jgi:hypothetical protein
MPAQPETPEDDQGDSADEGENDKITPIRPAAQSRQGKDQYAAESGERTTPTPVSSTSTPDPQLGPEEPKCFGVTWPAVPEPCTVRRHRRSTSCRDAMGTTIPRTRSVLPPFSTYHDPRSGHRRGSGRSNRTGPVMTFGHVLGAEWPVGEKREPGGNIGKAAMGQPTTSGRRAEIPAQGRRSLTLSA